MPIRVNHRLVEEPIDSVSSRPVYMKESIMLQWGINALMRYIHSPSPKEFSYTEAMEAPPTKEEEKIWGI